MQPSRIRQEEPAARSESPARRPNSELARVSCKYNCGPFGARELF